MEKWFVSMKKADFTQIAEKYHISPIIARLIRNRDILGDQNIEIGRASCREECSEPCRSRWSPYH